MTEEKIIQLRKVLKEKKLDGFIVPMNDEYQNEYVPESAKRMEWLTGFSGSAGTAVILKKTAAVFVDGRYILQAKNQVSSKLFEIYNLKNKSLSQWILEKCEKEGVIGYDPWLHTKANIKRLSSQVKNIFFEPSENLVDLIWKNKPKPPCGKVFVYPKKYAGENTEAKINRIAKKISLSGADAMIISAPDSLCWLLNIRGSDIAQTPFALAFMLLHKNKKIDIYIDKRKITPSVKKHFGANANIFEIEEINNFASKNKKIIIDPNSAPFWFFDRLIKSGCKIIEKEDFCQLDKACKNIIEQKGMINSHIRDGAAVSSFLFWLDENIGKIKITEKDIDEKITSFRKKQKSFKEPSFNTIAGFNENGAIVHYRADKKNSKEIKPDGILLIDSGGQYLDGTTDITRTIAIGKTTKEQKENFTRVLKGHIALAMAKFPEGTTGQELDALARYHLWQNGLDYDHGTGHGVGSYLSVHEGPQRISRYSNVPLHEGMVVSNEPGYYKEGEYGIRIESLVMVKKDLEISKGKKNFLCFETLSKAPLDIRLIEKNMLSRQELQWLENYHQKIAHELKGIVNKKVHEWLVASTII